MHNSKLNKHSIFGILLISIFVGMTVLLSALNTSKTYSITTDCSGVQILATNQTSTSETTIMLPIEQVSTFKIYVPADIAQTTEIIISAADQSTNIQTVIGKAKPLSGTTSGATTSSWDFAWPTFLWSRATSDSGLVSLSANIKFGGTGSCTYTSPTKYYIQYMNTNNIPINLVTMPTSISVTAGSTNNVITARPTILSPITTITTDALFNYAINYGMFEWSNNIGSISNSTSTYVSNNIVYFNAGNTAGSGKVSAILKYGGKISNIAYTPVTVKTIELAPQTTTSNQTTNTTTSTTNPSSSTTNTTNSTSTSSNDSTTTVSTDSKDVTTSELSTITQVSSSQISITDDITACVQTGLGSDERYNEINSGKSKPTTEEYNKIYNCFASTKYVIPTRFLPVATTAIEDLTTSSDVVVSNLQNTAKTVDKITKELLKFTGKSKPNSKVFIYIFSDPLVIATTTDADGNWQYTLEDPLVPGKHEVFAVVNQGDGSYKRSDPISFFISEASASAVNPNKLSLKLAKTPTVSQGNLYYYIAGSVGLLTFGLVVLFLSLRIHKHKKTIAMIHDTSCPNCNTPVREMLSTPVTPVPSITPATTADNTDFTKTVETPIVQQPINIQNNLEQPTSDEPQ